LSVKLRLARLGNRKRPFYRMVVAEDSHRRDGRFIEIVGTYDPLKKPAAIEVQADAILKWLAQGAQPTDTVKRILAKSGVWAHWRAVQEGKARPEELSGRIAGTIERNRESKPSEKAAAKIEAERAAEPAAAEVETEPAAEPAAAEVETETAEEKNSTEDT
jgi:small subunit ribosomal protein S16